MLISQGLNGSAIGLNHLDYSKMQYFQYLNGLNHQNEVLIYIINIIYILSFGYIHKELGNPVPPVQALVHMAYRPLKVVQLPVQIPNQ